MGLESIPWNLLKPILQAIVVIVISAWQLYNRDAAVAKLLKIRQQRGYDDKSFFSANIRRNFILGFSFFLIIGILVVVFNLYLFFRYEF